MAPRCGHGCRHPCGSPRAARNHRGRIINVHRRGGGTDREHAVEHRDRVRDASRLQEVPTKEALPRLHSRGLATRLGDREAISCDLLGAIEVVDSDEQLGAQQFRPLHVLVITECALGGCIERLERVGERAVRVGQPRFRGSRV